jgi:assimilatory nitrate reductase catalytic subunit
MTEDGFVRSTCPYCGVGCGVLLRKDDKGGLEVKGDPEHPANYGRLCSKGSALGETVGLEDRLLEPQVDGKPAKWDDALQLVADKFTASIREHGPESVALYVSGQLLTEDYYVANKFMKGLVGSANIDTNSRLCMASTVAGHKRAFGTDTVPGNYEDLEQADLIVLVGSNLAWCHPVLYQRILAARQTRTTKIVVIDPRRTASCDGADMHLAVKPGADVAIFNWLLSEIADQGAVDDDFLKNTNGFDQALAAAKADEFDSGLTEAELKEFCDLWIGTERVVTIFSQGVNQSTSGSDKVNAILNCHLATGRIGKVGMGPFSVTGQPNAMGGREVGGLANMLACHLDIENPEHRDAVQEFWKSPHIPTKQGLKAVDMFDAVADGKIKALWIIHTNPAVTMPKADKVRDAIASCDFVVVSDITDQTDTARLADVVLPAAAWAEKSGTVTNSDRTISRQRKILDAPGQSRADWDILSEVGRRMGWNDGFDYEHPSEIFAEYAKMSAISGEFGKDFDISLLGGIDVAAYDALVPQQWPLTKHRQGGRFFADGKFFHADSKAKFVAVSTRAPAKVPQSPKQFQLNTGRVRDHWHTMTRTGLSSKLSSHAAEPYLEVNPADALRLGLGYADLAKVSGPEGASVLRVRVTDAVQVGQVFAPIHWTGETAPTGRIDAAVEANIDPISGQPESKASVVTVEKYRANWYGFAVSRSKLTLECDYWAVAKTPSGYRAEIAGLNTVEDWDKAAKTLFGIDDAHVTSIVDTQRGTARLAFEQDGQVIAALFVSRSPVAVMRDYIAKFPDQILLGRTPADVPDPGPTLCSCFGVGINTIIDAIETGGLMTVDAIGASLDAGTNCGSCRPEIAALIAKRSMVEAAE